MIDFGNLIGKEKSICVWKTLFKVSLFGFLSLIGLCFKDLQIMKADCENLRNCLIGLFKRQERVQFEITNPEVQTDFLSEEISAILTNAKKRVGRFRVRNNVQLCAFVGEMEDWQVLNEPRVEFFFESETASVGRIGRIEVERQQID